MFNRSQLMKKTKKKRLKWTLMHENWGYKEWLKVWWSDECFMKKRSEQHHQWIFWMQSDKWKKFYINDKVPKKLRVMIWTAFCAECKSDLVICWEDSDFKKGDIMNKMYREILKNQLFTLLDNSDEIFMQNNISIHCVIIVKQFFEKRIYNIMKWSSYSSDLNSIEHCWFSLKERIYNVCSLLNKYKGKKYIKKWLQSVCVNSWSEYVKKSFLINLVKLMLRCVCAVIDINGGYTHY